MNFASFVPVALTSAQFERAIGFDSVTSMRPCFTGDFQDMTYESKEDEESWLPLWLSSTLKKRKSKMNKHKLRKRRKKERLKVRKS